MKIKFFLKFGLILIFLTVFFVAKPNRVFAAAGQSMTSTQSGPFNVGTTWGKACSSGCVAGTDFPGGLYGAIIASGTTVTLDSPRTIPFLNINSGGILDGSSYLLTVTNLTAVWINGTYAGTGGLDYSGSGISIVGTGNVTNTGTTTLSSVGGLTFSTGNNLTFSGPIVLSGNTIATNRGIITMNPGANIFGTATSSTLTQFTDATLNFAGNSLMATGTLIATSTGNTVNYNLAGDQTCKNTAYYNLTFSGSGTKVCNPTSAVNVTTSGTVNWFPSAWYGNSGTWNYRKAITIDHNKIASSTAETYANFPVLISVTDTDLISHASSTGADILFTKADGITKLNHEIETYASSTGNLVSWVNVGTEGLSTSTDTTLYMYYGNSSATNQQTATSTWDSNFAAVYHMKETLTGSGQLMYDSTVNAVNATSSTGWLSSNQVAGQVGGSLNFNSFNATYFISSSTALRVVNVTAQAWVNSTSTNRAILIDIIIPNPKSGDLPYALDITSTGLARFYVVSGGATSSATSTLAINDGNWHNIVGTYDGTTMKLYIDGVLNKTETSFSGDLPLVGILDIGADGNIRIMNGQLDEMRVSSLARSADWVLTEYTNQNSPGTFISAGSEQTESSGAQSVTGNLIIGANTTVKSTNNVLTVSGDFTNNGVFTHNNGTVSFNTAGTSIISGTSTSFKNLTLATAGQTVKFHTALSDPPVYSIAGIFSATGTLGSLVYIQSDLPGTRWLVNLNTAQSNITYANIKDSGCFAGTQNITVSNSQDGENNGSCWLGFVIISSGRSVAYFGGAVAPVEIGSGGGIEILGGDPGGNGTSTPPVEEGSGGGSTPPVTGGGGGGGGEASP